MEPQQQQQNQQQQNEDSGSSGKGNGFLCRQSSTRWTPTTDQIRILKDLYYNNGVRSPSAEQIQRISARLRQYGKIEGKNVFYWFQNHKARERQKKRFTTSDSPSMQRGGVSVWKPDEAFHNKFPNISHGVSSASPSSASTLTVGQNMGNYGYGSVTMEKNFRDCSISAAGGGSSTTDVGGGSLSHNFGWVGVDPYSSPYSFIDKRKLLEDDDDDEEEEEEDEASPEIETLPLFPMHGEDINGIKHNSHGYYSGWYRSEDGGHRGGSRTSLELSLNSYSRRSPDSL